MTTIVKWLIAASAAAATAGAFGFVDFSPGECKEGYSRNSFGVCQQNWETPEVQIPIPPEISQLATVFGGSVTALVPLGGAVLATVTGQDQVIEILKDASGDTITTIEKAAGDTFSTVVKAAKDVAATYEKGWRDASEQAKRSFSDTVDAGTAVARYVERQGKDLGKIAETNATRVKQGKIIDAMWGVATEPLQASERNFAKATQESEVIAAATQSAAATYGGPAGAAAYAAWMTYNTTGDPNLALRAGILSAITSQTGSMNSTASDAVLRKAALAGAAGGIAVAAAGGDETAITQGFLKSGSGVLIQVGTHKVRGFSPQAAQAVDAVQCISARDLDCLSRTPYVQEKGKILTDNLGRPRYAKRIEDVKEYVGTWSKMAENSDLAKKYKLITKFSKLKDMEAIPLLDNQWIMTWNMGTKELQFGTPAVVLTYVGTNKPFISRVTYTDSRSLKPGDRPPVTVTAETLSQAVRIRSSSEVVSNVMVDGEERPTYNYYAWLALKPELANQIRSAEYSFDHPSFRNPKPGRWNGDRFEARWIGWGCTDSALVVATLIDGSKVTGRFNMCETGPG